MGLHSSLAEVPEQQQRWVMPGLHLCKFVSFFTRTDLDKIQSKCVREKGTITITKHTNEQPVTLLFYLNVQKLSM